MASHNSKISFNRNSVYKFRVQFNSLLTLHFVFVLGVGSECASVGLIGSYAEFFTSLMGFYFVWLVDGRVEIRRGLGFTGANAVSQCSGVQQMELLGRFYIV